MTSVPPRSVSAERGVEGAATHILHLDMDSFFVAVEVKDNPALAGLAVVVGGSGERAVVASASYEARRYGVSSAMAMAEARRLCPGLVVVEGRHDRYGDVSRQLMALLEEVTPLVEPVALDEAYLDVAGALGRGGSALGLAEQLRRDVHGRLALPCSVGVARTKLLAKLASKAAKPRPGGTPGEGRGVVVVRPEEEDAFLGSHPIRALPGVGPRSAEKLARYGVETVQDLTLVEVGSLVRLLGHAHGTTLHALAHGRDPRPVRAGRDVSSIGHEETFPRDEHSAERLAGVAREMAQAVAARCRQGKVVPRRVSVKVRFGDFKTITRSRTLPVPATTGRELAQVAAELLEGVAVEKGVRLLGVHVSLLVPFEAAAATARQLPLFAALEEPDERSQRQEGLEVAADAIRERYGKDAIASLGSVARRQPH